MLPGDRVRTKGLGPLNLEYINEKLNNAIKTQNTNIPQRKYGGASFEPDFNWLNTKRPKKTDIHTIRKWNITRLNLVEAISSSLQL
jgi:hypothetical protein